MADKSINELVAADQITATDLFVLEQNNVAKKLTGQILLNWLTKAADGHGGISSIEKLSTNSLTDTYRITFADTTTFDFDVTNGKGITGISPGTTTELQTEYIINYNDGTHDSFIVKNGEASAKGDDAYVWIKYASQEPTEGSHSMSDLPDNWIGIYSGRSETAPTDYTQYSWFNFKGEKGDLGDPATLIDSKVEYHASASCLYAPSGSWSTSIPYVPQGQYLWTRITNTFNTGSPVIAYSVSRMGVDGTGTGTVTMVNGKTPSDSGDVTLAAGDVNALPITGGNMQGDVSMRENRILRLPDPVYLNEAANKEYVDAQVSTLAERVGVQYIYAYDENLITFFMDSSYTELCDFDKVLSLMEKGIVYVKTPYFVSPIISANTADEEITFYNPLEDENQSHHFG